MSFLVAAQGALGLIRLLTVRHALSHVALHLLFFFWVYPHPVLPEAWTARSPTADGIGVLPSIETGTELGWL